MFGVRPGLWTERDGKDDSGLTVDVTFEDADPPPAFAVEVTRLRADFEEWDEDDLQRFTARVARVTKANGWAGFSIGLAPETSFKAGLTPAAGRMVEWMTAANLTRLGPGSWPADVSMALQGRLRQVKGRDFAKECREARLKGVIEVRRLPKPETHVFPVVEFSDHKSLQRPLARAMREKAARSLGIAKDRDYVTMLAVDVEREDARSYLGEGVRVPDFTEKIDHLWLFVRGDGGDLEDGFYASRSRERRRMTRLDLGGLGT